MKPILYVGNQNYSSWSMRPWLVLTWANIDFETRVIPLGGDGYGERRMPSVLSVSPSGTVPTLHLGALSIGDSLAISEWAAEEAPALWPADRGLRALARAATCEMHSGFGALRSNLPCNIRRRAAPRKHDVATQRDIDRVLELWRTMLDRSGGPFLCGETPTIPDAFFTPVATRFRTYAVDTGGLAPYVDKLLADPAFLAWEAAGVAEPWTMPVWDDV
jgi:glutathione S-transferase